MSKYLNYLITLAIFMSVLGAYSVPSWSTSTSADFGTLILPLKNAPGGQVILKDNVANHNHHFKAYIEKSAVSVWKGAKVAAIVLDYETGGSGTFKVLYFLTLKDNHWVPKAWTDLGDRTKIRYLSLYRHGKIFVGMIRHRKNDPKCCPSLRELRVFDVTEKSLRSSGSYDVDLFPDEVSCDVASLGTTASLELIPAVSFSPHAKGHKRAIPTHVGLIENGKYVLMRIVNVKNYVDLWFQEHDPTINIAINRLKLALNKDVSTLSAPFDILPPRPGINDFAIFIKKIPFKNGIGIGFVGRVVKDLSCVDKKQLKFFYMGLDNKQKYLVTFSKKIAISEKVPSELWICKGGVAGLQEQLRKIKQKFLELGYDAVSKDLSKIYKFISTLEIKDN